MIEWLNNWYLSNCNGDWEHTYGIKIETIDNPGWKVIIDLSETRFEELKLDMSFTEKNDLDWISYGIEDGIFKGYGDPTKLESILSIFRNLVER
ncbi:MAG: immunity 53 family protein [Carboxylicivirga sp.]|jgi:hypothetical protein|nr:immunity 53 family protein [Carboxylicivirga sp.]